MTKFLVASRHAETLGDGRPVAPGEHVDLSADAQKDPHNQRLIEDEQLLAVAPKGKSPGGSQ